MINLSIHLDISSTALDNTGCESLIWYSSNTKLLLCCSYISYDILCLYIDYAQYPYVVYIGVIEGHKLFHLFVQYLSHLNNYIWLKILRVILVW